ncbi:MAG: transposase [Cyanobacteria bacterium P01_D01_bin.71]
MEDDILEFDPSKLNSLEKIDFSLIESFIADAEEKARVLRRFHAVVDILQASEKKTQERIRLWADRLECSPSTVYRLVKRVKEEQTLAAVVRNRRSDFGELKGSRHWKAPCSQSSPKSDKEKAEVLAYWKDFIERTYREGNTGARFMNRNQVFTQVMGHAELELGLQRGQYPCRPFVYEVISRYGPYIKRNKKRPRRPYQGPKIVVRTYYYDDSGEKVFEEIIVERSNQVWQIDHTQLNNLFVDANYDEIGAVFVTSVIDTYSGCAMGFHLSFDSPNSYSVALALRHASLPKSYGPEYELRKEWIVCGLPDYILTDSAKEFKEAAHTKRIASALGIKLRYRVEVEDGSVIERSYLEHKEELDSYLQGYRGGNLQERTKDPEKYACMTYEEYERRLVRFYIDHRNQHAYPRVKNQTRLQRWEAGLIGEPNVPDERYLDICLLKQDSRTVQAYGTIEFECLVYVTGWQFDDKGLWRYQKKDNFLLHLESEKITLRYTPDNIIYILAYAKEADNQPSRFLGVLRARDIEEEHLSLKEWKTRKALINEEYGNLDQSSILQYQRDLHRRGNELTKESRKRRQSRKERKRQEQDRITRAAEQSNVIKANFSQKPKEDKVQVPEEIVVEASDIQIPEVMESQQDQPEIAEPTVVYAVSDWNEYIGNDW